VIAEGTPDELKDRVGGERLEVTLSDEVEGERAIEVLSPLCGRGDPPDGRRRARHARGHAARGLDRRGVRLLDAADIDIEDLGHAPPTLDDVFLTLTGKRAEEAPVARRGGRRMSSLAYAISDTAVIGQAQPQARSRASPTC
jgi:ABC-2 type transport system ATP-binding protein